MSIYSSSMELTRKLNALIDKLEIEPVAGLSQKKTNFILADEISNDVIQIAMQAAYQATSELRKDLKKVMEGLCYVCINAECSAGED